MEKSVTYNRWLSNSDDVTNNLWAGSKNNDVELLFNPTGKPIRGTDSQGTGHYGAPRGNRTHLGIDLVSDIDQPIIAPINGYAMNFIGGTTNYEMLDITPSDSVISKIRILYVKKNDNPHWKKYQIFKGETIIGYAADLNGDRYYPNASGMINHIHLQIMVNGNWVDPTPYFFR